MAHVTELRSRVRQMQGIPADAQALETPPELARLLPGGLQCGAAYSVHGSTSLALALLAGPSGAGRWCGVVGMPHLGAEAAAASGVDLTRTVLVPDPGTSWMNATSTLTDVLDVVLVHPVGRVHEAQASRLGARLRTRGSTLLVLGHWPRAHATLRIERGVWVGLGEGHGHLRARAAVVSATDRAGRTYSASLWLPAPASGPACPVEVQAAYDLNDLLGGVPDDQLGSPPDDARRGTDADAEPILAS